MIVCVGARIQAGSSAPGLMPTSSGSALMACHMLDSRQACISCAGTAELTTGVPLFLNACQVEPSCDRMVEAFAWVIRCLSLLHARNDDRGKPLRAASVKDHLWSAK